MADGPLSFLPMDRSERRKLVREAERQAAKRYDELTGPAAEHDVRQRLSHRSGPAQLTLTAMTAGWRAVRTYWMNREDQPSYHVLLDKADGRKLTIEIVLSHTTSRFVLATHTGPDGRGTHIHDLTTLGRYITPEGPMPG